MAKNLINCGTGAGGAKTNANGKPYEDLVELKTEYNIVDVIKIDKKHSVYVVVFKDSDRKFITTKQGTFPKYMFNKRASDILDAHGCKNPDECFIDEDNKKIFIIEKKFQQCSGSVCEKIQTAPFKKLQYESLYPEYKIYYIFCLSNWYKIHCIRELQLLTILNFPTFFGDDIDYKSKIIHYILNY